MSIESRILKKFESQKSNPKKFSDDSDPAPQKFSDPDSPGREENFPECDCQEFWIDSFKKIRCSICEPPPKFVFVAEEFFFDDDGNRWSVSSDDGADFEWRATKITLRCSPNKKDSAKS